MDRTVADHLAAACEARRSCVKSGNSEWLGRWTDQINEIMDSAPSGSGFDNGVSIDWDVSGFGKLVFYAPYHHTNDVGMYDGWTDHTVTARPAFHLGLDITVSGRDRNDFKDYAGEIFHSWLTAAVSHV